MKITRTNTEGKEQPIRRRDFLQMAGLGLLGTVALPSFQGYRSVEISSKLKRAKIGVQLYTVREEFKKDIAGTLNRLADIGFEAVETAFWPEGITLHQAGEYIKAAGLSVSSAHIELPFGEHKQVMLETAAAFGCNKMIWHGWPEDKRYSTLEGTKELAHLYNEASQFAKSNGLQFGIHNHWWEFRNKIEGRFVYEVLLDTLDKDILFEIDTYWVKVAGHNPADIVHRFGSRAPLLHIKDGPAQWKDSLPEDNPDPMTAVGKGSQNFPAIVAAANGNTEWMIVEMDKTATDVFEALQESYNYLVKKNLAKGKKPANR